MKKKILFALIALPFVVLTDGCKKGEDDPGISFRSRKGRVAGEWKLVDYKATDTDASGVTTITSNGSTYAVTTPFGNASGTWTKEITLEKDGTYSMTDVTDGTTETSKGTWNFTSKIGELKNKSQITLYETSYVSGSTSNTWTGNYVDVVYDLKELRNKKMVWYVKVSSTVSAQTSTWEETLTFEPK